MSVPRHDPVMTQPASAPPPDSGLLLAGLAGVAGTALALLALSGPGLLAAGVLVMQLVLVPGVLTVLNGPARRGALLVATAAAVAAGAVVLSEKGGVDGLAGLVALALVAALLQQLARRGRDRVTEGLADTLLVVVLVGAASCLVALRADPRPGAGAVTVGAITAAGAGLLVGRLGDRLLPTPLLLVRSSRGLAGLLLGLAAGAGAGALAGAGGSTGGCALLGLAAAAAAAAADVAVDVGATDIGAVGTGAVGIGAVDVAAGGVRRGSADARRVAALRPVAALLPYAMLGPVALLGGRLVLGSWAAGS